MEFTAQTSVIEPPDRPHGASRPDWRSLLDSILAVAGCEEGLIGDVTVSDIGLRSFRSRHHSLSRDLPSGASAAIARAVDGEIVSVDVDSEHRLLLVPLETSDGATVGVAGILGSSCRVERASQSVSRDAFGPVADALDRVGLSGAFGPAEIDFLAWVAGSAAYGVLVLGADGLVEVANHTALTMLGLHEIEVVGSPLTGFLETSDLRWLLDAIAGRQPSDAEPSRRTVTLLAGSEACFRADLAVAPLIDDPERRGVVMFRSVESELEAHAVARRAADLLAFSPDLVMWTDDAGRIEYLNSGGRAILGVDDPSAMSIVDAFPSWAVDVFDREIRPALHASGVWAGDLALLGATGEEIPASLTFLFRKEQEGSYLALHARDLRAQSQLDRLQDAFVSTVSHELRTPLSSILGYLEMLADGDFGRTTDEQAIALDTMHRNGTRLLDLVDELLRIASVGHTGVADPRPVDVAAIVESLIADRPGWAGRVELDSADRAGCAVLGDEQELASLIECLVGNGLKFSGDTEPVTVRVARIDPWIELAFEDRGVGIPSAELESVFDRFFRASNARELEAPGVGLGLAIARAIVRTHGGEMSIDSELGTGTITRVLLPAADTETRR